MFAVFAGKDGSRGLAKSSLEAQYATDKYDDLNEKEQGVLNDWYHYFSQRYNIVGKVSVAKI